MYLGGGVNYLIRGGRGGSSFKTRSAEFHGTVEEDPTCSPWGRTKHIGVRDFLVRNTCDAGKVRVVCVRTWTCFKTLGTQKFHRHAKDNPQCSVIMIQMLGLTVSAASCLIGNVGCCEARRD